MARDQTPSEPAAHQRRKRGPRPSRTLPPGVRLVKTLRAHSAAITAMEWSPNGRFLATASEDTEVRIWDASTLELIHKITDHQATVTAVAFDPLSRFLATADRTGRAVLWLADGWSKDHELSGVRTHVRTLAFNPRPEGKTGYEPALAIGGTSDAELCTLSGQVYSRLSALSLHEQIEALAFDPAGQIIATAANAGLLETWDVSSGRLLETLRGHDGTIRAVVFSPDGNLLASAAEDQTIKIWSARSGELLRTLEGHASSVHHLFFLQDGQLLISAGGDGEVIFWDCHKWASACSVSSSPSVGQGTRPRVALHPRIPMLASTGIGGARDDGTSVQLWSINSEHVLTGVKKPTSVTYTSAKIVLVGESGVGKTGLGYRLATGTFKNHPSTHGQQFWTLDELGATRTDGAECEAILWDLAGQPDYRLVHALFLDDADIALVLFDPTRGDDPLRGVDYWLRQLGGKREVILVAARADLGLARLTEQDIRRFCSERDVNHYIVTSALTGEGLSELVTAMRDIVDWDARPTTVTTTTFKWIKDTVLDLKEHRTTGRVVVTPAELRDLLEESDPRRQFSDAEMLAAVRHLAHHGYVAQLRTSRGEQRIVLRPELVNNVASSIVLKARRNERGLGFVEEGEVLGGRQQFTGLVGLDEDEQEALLDAAVGMFLSHNVCLRETDTSQVLLVFPDLINLRRPDSSDAGPMTDGASYTVTGAVENVYASLVVLLGYTNAFTRTQQWRDQAEYVVKGGSVCGFRLEAAREGELDFVLYFRSGVEQSTRMLFQGLFETFLSRRDVTVHRYPPIYCSNDPRHRLNRAVVREHLALEIDEAHCSMCGERVSLAHADEPIKLTRDQLAALDGQRYTAARRSRFEQALFTLKTKLALSREDQPTCFISYAWGDSAHESWTVDLAQDLSKAGITVILDKWENNRVGASVPRFIERIESADWVIVIGTPRYRTKYENAERMGGFVAAAEGDLIGNRMIGTEAAKETVLPVLVKGTPATSFPALLNGRVHSDFRSPDQYFTSAFDLILRMHGLSVADPQIAQTRAELNPPEPVLAPSEPLPRS